jgi:uncharacterized protein YbjT (DUF2867 family)
MAEQLVTVFGGTGFLGRRIVRHLRDQGFALRIASRRAQPAGQGTGGESIRADINNEASVMAAAVGAYAVVNAVSLYSESGSETFNAIHVKAAERIAMSRAVDSPVSSAAWKTISITSASPSKRQSVIHVKQAWGNPCSILV